MNTDAALAVLEKLAPTTAAAAKTLHQETTKPHWHVHSSLGGGYLCECDSHAVLTAAERDEALKEEKGHWLDFKAEAESDPACISRIRITGNIRQMHFDINDIDSMGWYRAVDGWECWEAICLDEEDE
jgi:hypothetical protein